MSSTILIIDDDERVHRTVEEQLAGEGTLVHAHDGLRGIQIATREHPDLILLDMNLPQLDGLKVCRHLKGCEETRDIPILFLTIADNASQVARALELGASDYIRKPVESVELRARVHANLRTKRMVDLLRVQARIDPLTGLMNRAALDDALAASLSAYDRAGAPMSVLMLDVDHFKRINDSSGHGVGDDVLRHLGAVIRSVCRGHDGASRLGGDEFVVVFGHTDADQAPLAARRLLAEIANARIAPASGEPPLTVSAGLVSCETLPGLPRPSDLLKAADAALYQAKAQGRDCLVVAGSETER